MSTFDGYRDEVGAWSVDVNRRESAARPSEFDPADWHLVGTAGEPVFAAGFDNYPGVPNAPVRFMRDAAGGVRLQGLARKVGTFAAYPGTLVFTLPDGYRPAFELSTFGANVGGATGRVDVHADGGVYVVDGANFVAFDAVSFPAETYATVVCLGDSITHGFNAPAPYSTALQASLGGRARVVEKGVNGAALSTFAARLATDVLSFSPTYCVVQGGVNDLMADASATAIIATLTALYSSLVANGIRPIVSTLAPWAGYASYTLARESVRESVNGWIRRQPFDLVDLDTVLGDGSLRPHVRAAFDSDGLHPNAAGQSAIADAVFSVTFGRQAV